MQHPRTALLSPNYTSFSETFIQAHKKYLKNVLFYFGGSLPSSVENQGEILPRGILKKALLYIFKLAYREFTFHEFMVLRSFKKNKVQLVFCEYGTTGVAAMKICERLKLPLIVHFHGYDASEYELVKRYELAYKAMFQYARRIIVVSGLMKENLVRLSCPPEKIIVTPCGPNEEFDKITPDYNALTLLSSGRFVDKKAPYYTILAFRMALDECPEASLVLAGNGPLFNTCLNLVEYLNLKGKVMLPGEVNRDELLEYLKSARGYVQHSVTALNGDAEGTPVSILEASLAGLPVISTRHAGIGEVFVDGETGFLVNEHDVEAMANRMIRILKDKELSMKLGRAGKEYVKANYSMKTHIGYLQNAIDESSS